MGLLLACAQICGTAQSSSELDFILLPFLRANGAFRALGPSAKIEAPKRCFTTVPKY